MSSQTITLIGSVLVALMGGGAIKAFFDYLNDRKRAGIEEDTSHFQTLIEMNTLLRQELKDVRSELETERRQRVMLEIKVAQLEARLGESGA